MLWQSLNPVTPACFTQPQDSRFTKARMIVGISCSRLHLRAATAAALLALGLGLNGCAEMSDTMATAFADPAKYDLYDCKQLETERKNLANRSAELRGLMAKAETGVAGPVVAELAYRNEYVSVRGQASFAEEAWRRSKCVSTPATATPTPAPSVAAPATPRAAQPSRSGSAVY